jgi:Flp pilus assembly protein TadD
MRSLLTKGICLALALSAAGTAQAAQKRAMTTSSPG